MVSQKLMHEHPEAVKGLLRAPSGRCRSDAAARSLLKRHALALAIMRNCNDGSDA
jgi:hypothetical protein